MKNNPDKKTIDFIQQLSKLQLSDTEAQDMRERLIAYADLHSVPGKVRNPVPSPFYWRLGSVLAAVVILIGGGVGVTNAAGNALPGQPFYQIKVSVIEPVQGALITSTEGKAQWENQIAERRLSEASTLAVQNKLSSSTSDYLATQVAIASDRSQAEANKLAASGNADQALAVRSDLEARLSAHAALLAVIAPRLAEAGDASTTAEVALLYQKVNAVRNSVMQSRIATEEVINASTTVALAPKSVTPAIVMSASDRGDEKTNKKVTSNTAPVVAIASRKRAQQEADDFKSHVESLLALLPHASSTASTTITVTASSTASSTIIIQDGDSTSIQE